MNEINRFMPPNNGKSKENSERDFREIVREELNRSKDDIILILEKLFKKNDDRAFQNVQIILDEISKNTISIEGYIEFFTENIDQSIKDSIITSHNSLADGLNGLMEIGKLSNQLISELTKSTNLTNQANSKLIIENILPLAETNNERSYLLSSLVDMLKNLSLQFASIKTEIKKLRNSVSTDPDRQTSDPDIRLINQSENINYRSYSYFYCFKDYCQKMSKILNLKQSAIDKSDSPVKKIMFVSMKVIAAVIYCIGEGPATTFSRPLLMKRIRERFKVKIRKDYFNNTLNLLTIKGFISTTKLNNAFIYSANSETNRILSRFKQGGLI